MSVSPPDILACAISIHSEINTEAGRRAAVSRAYYSAYHAARNFHIGLPQPGKIINARGLHEQLAEQLANPNLAESHSQYSISRKLGVLLQDFHRDRTLSDYKLDLSVNDAEAKTAIAKAKKIIELI